MVYCQSAEDVTTRVLNRRVKEGIYCSIKIMAEEPQQFTGTAVYPVTMDTMVPRMSG